MARHRARRRHRPQRPKARDGPHALRRQHVLLDRHVAREAAITIAREQTPAHKMGGGLLTPATLGEGYLERVRKGGLFTEIRMMP